MCVQIFSDSSFLNGGNLRGNSRELKRELKGKLKTDFNPILLKFVPIGTRFPIN